MNRHITLIFELQSLNHNFNSKTKKFQNLKNKSVLWNDSYQIKNLKLWNILVLN